MLREINDRTSQYQINVVIMETSIPVNITLHKIYLWWIIVNLFIISTSGYVAWMRLNVNVTLLHNLSASLSTFTLLLNINLGFYAHRWTWFTIAFITFVQFKYYIILLFDIEYIIRLYFASFFSALFLISSISLYHFCTY